MPFGLELLLLVTLWLCCAVVLSCRGVLWCVCGDEAVNGLELNELY